MPELPEVETVRRVLSPQLCGRTITHVTLLNSHIIAHPEPDSFCQALSCQQIERIDRRGKFLLFIFQSGDRMLIHLRMTGTLFIAPVSLPMDKHTHLLLSLSDGQQLRFCDQRRFGRFWFFRQNEPDHCSGISGLGLEPFDERLCGAYLSQHWHGSKRAVKTCLLDQSVVAGIGNIYADETLYALHIHPGTPACALSDAQFDLLARQIPQTLQFAIDKNEISPADYLNGRGSNYRNTPFLSVYGRAGAPCPHCGATLKRSIVAGRGTVYCPHCQPFSP